MKIKTRGLGYLKDANGKIISKVDLPPGEHEFEDGITFVEVKDDVELKAMSTPEASVTKEMEIEQKVRNEIRRMAIESLKARGEL